MPATAAPDTPTLLAILTPSGRVSLTLVHRGAFPLPAKTAARIEQAFAQGTGHGLLQLGAAELNTRLGPTLAWWRELGHQLVAAACALADPLAPEAVNLPAQDHTALDALAAKVPPVLARRVRDSGVKPQQRRGAVLAGQQYVLDGLSLLVVVARCAA